MTKRTRYIRNFVMTVPRVAIREPGIYQIQVKVSAVFIEKVGEVPNPPPQPRSGLGAILLMVGSYVALGLMIIWGG